MDLIKKKSIETLVDNSIKSFSNALLKRYKKESDKANGVINLKKKNVERVHIEKNV